LIGNCTFGEQFSMNSGISHRHSAGSLTEQFDAYSFQTLEEQNCEFQEPFNFDIQEYQPACSHLQGLSFRLIRALKFS